MNFPQFWAKGTFEKWEAIYQSETANWATCELVRTIGNRDVHPDVQIVIGLHDETTRVESKLKLA